MTAWCHADVLLRLDSADRGDIVTDMAMMLVNEHGLGSLTLRRVAAQAGLTPPALVNRFGSRAEMLLVIVTIFGQRWTGWLLCREYVGIAGMLPSASEDLIGVRFWLALHELVRADPDLAVRFGRFCREERSILSYWLRVDGGRRPDESTLDAMVALVHGLRAAVAATDDPLPLDRAKTALERHAVWSRG